MQSSDGGILGVQVDNLDPFIMNLYSENATCGLLFEYDLVEGNHTMSMTFLGNWTLKGITQGSSLHITDIKYVHYSGWPMRNTDHRQ